MGKAKGGGIRSAYDLAIERLDKGGGRMVRLTEEQKQEIARIDREAEAKVAELEIMLGQQIAAAEAAGDEEKATQLKEQKSLEIRRIRERAEEARGRVRSAQDAAG